MKLTNKTRFLSAGALLAVLTASLYATMTFTPSTQPATILGKYALEDTSLAGGTLAYRPFFENGAWQGDIIQYEIDANGNRSTDASVGSNSPVVPGSSGGCGQTAPGGCWMARATFESKVASVTDYWKEVTNGRNIFTYGDTDNDGVGDTQVDFLWSNLSDIQRAVLDATTAADPTPLTAAYDSPILNYIRGDASNNTSNGGSYRTRYSLLGDIINSWPIYIGAPRENYTFGDFITFKNAYSGSNQRDGRIAVGANDGMLHVLDEDDGSEVYAYIPTMVHGKLDRLSVRPYDSINHTSYVDGKLTSVSAQVNGTWKSVLVGGLGAGGAGLFALDVTNPDMSSDKILFEVTGSDVGYIYSQPSIVRLADDNWYIITGNGYGTGGNGKLLLISLNDGTYTSLSTGVAAGLSGTTVVDTNADSYADIAFAGDTDGNMWKFYLGSSPPLTNPERIYQPPVAVGTDQPITTRPDVGEHPLGGYMVLFGTGSITSLTDAIDPAYPTQALYGIWDSGPGEVVVAQTLVEVSDATFTDGTDTYTETVRYISTNNSLDYNCAANDATCDIGWRVNLPNTGERVVGPPQLRNSRMIVVTSNPLGNSDGSDLIGDSWLMSVNFLTGGDNNAIVLNLNGDGDLNTGDAVDISATSTPDLRAPVGLHLGDGNISQPTLASVSSGIDAIFINGLRMPLPIIQQVDGPLLAGHLDVETDSPDGGNIATNNISKHSERYNVEKHDGLGHGIDGHFHDYDTSNNITYVDIFELEHRRGKASAAATAAPCNPSTPNQKTIDVNGECLLALEGELNRAYDTLATDGDGVDEGSPASEVYALGTTTPMAANQKFIVVVTNADLTPAADLQIGCRTWNAEDYQDMITSQLEAGKTPSQLLDDEHGNASLIFTAADIASGNSDPTGISCPDDSPNPTLRIKFATTDILQAGIHGTRAQCVLGLHDYRDPVDYWDSEVLCHAPKHLYGETTVNCDGLKTPHGEDLRDPGAAYIKDPANNLHITELPSKEGTGYRWRNGALTVQLLKVGDPAISDSVDAKYTLQDPAYLPTKGGRFGGTYAKAFTTTVVSGDTPVMALTEGLNESGLLHETTVYWHLGDLSDGIQRGSPASVPCYGDPSWSSVWTQETRGLTLGQYQALYEDIDASVLAAYDAAVLALEDALLGDDETATNQALLELGKLLAGNPDLAIYDRYRDYAPGNIPEQHLREIDQDKIPDPDDPDDNPSGDDGTPAEVDDLTTGTGTALNRDILGPNFAIGRRTWIDLRQ